MGGTSYLEGRLEVCHSGNWGTVCDDDFGAPEAKVACRRLGYSAQGKLHDEALGSKVEASEQ